MISIYIYRKLEITNSEMPSNEKVKVKILISVSKRVFDLFSNFKETNVTN